MGKLCATLGSTARVFVLLASLFSASQQASAQELPAGPAEESPEQSAKGQEPVSIVEAPQDLSVAAAGNVVERVGEVNAWRSCHDPDMKASPISAVKSS